MLRILSERHSNASDLLVGEPVHAHQARGCPKIAIEAITKIAGKMTRQ
jgi:hypothetical protein